MYIKKIKFIYIIFLIIPMISRITFNELDKKSMSKLFKSIYYYKKNSKKSFKSFFLREKYLFFMFYKNI